MILKVAVTIVYALFIGTGFSKSLDCYSCASANNGNPDCEDPLNPDSDRISTETCLPRGLLSFSANESDGGPLGCAKLLVTNGDKSYFWRICAPLEENGLKYCDNLKKNLLAEGATLEMCETCDTDLCNA